MKKQSPVLLYIIIGIAGIGLLSWIMKEPGNLLRTIVMTAIVATLIFFVARAILRRRAYGGNNDEMRKYRRAVKQSQKKYQHNTNTNKTRTQSRPIKRRRRPSHLTVIKGN